MAKSSANRTTVHIQRILQDDYVQEQLRSAANGLLGAYARARKQREGAVEDKRFYGSLRQVASAAGNLTRAVRRPEPEPPHRLRRLVLIGLATAGAIALTAKLQRLEAARRKPSESSSSGTANNHTGPGQASREPDAVATPTAHS